MCKQRIAQILSLKSKILDIYPVIPQIRLNSISKEIENLFQDLDRKNVSELDDIQKLAKAKYLAYKRIYVKSETEKIKISGKDSKPTSNSVEANVNDIINNIYFKVDEEESSKSNDNVVSSSSKKIFEEFTKSDNGTSNSFDKPVLRVEDVKKYDEMIDFLGGSKGKEWTPQFENIKKEHFQPSQIKEFQERYLTAADELSSKMNEDSFESLRKRIDKLRQEGKDSQIQDEFSKFDFNFNNFKLPDGTMDRAKQIKFIAKVYNVYFNEGGEEYAKTVDISGLSLSEKEQNNSKPENDDDNPVRSIFKPEVVDEQSVHNLSEMKMGMGEFQFVKYKELDEKESNLENDASSGREKFVWRDGNLVPGEGKIRRTVSHINWNSSNLDPKDLKKHRELLDRQHYGGPLWEGIRKINPWELPISVSKQDMEENAVPKEAANLKVNSDSGFEEIVR